MPGDDRVADGEPEPLPFPGAHLFRGEVGIEYLVDDVGGNATALVPEGNFYVPAGRDGVDTFPLDGDRFSADEQRSTVRHRFPGIDGNIAEYLAHLDTVDVQHREIVREGKFRQHIRAGQG